MASTAQRITLAVWEIPATVVAGERFTIKAGAKASNVRGLHGQRIEACDAAGHVIASGELGATPWPETEALYWTALTLLAPARPGMASLSVRFKAADTPHGEAVSHVNVVVVPPPEHTVTITLRDKDTAAPIAGADIRLGAHRATTAASGRAEMRLSKGQHDLAIWKVGYEAPRRTVAVDGDMSIEVRATVVVEENVDRAWRA